jgi:hypothetical protein
MAIGLILADNVTQGMPGRRRRRGGKTIVCGDCGQDAGRLPDGTYACAAGHVTEEPKKKKKSKGKGKK